MNIINKIAPHLDRATAGDCDDADMLDMEFGGITDDEYLVHSLVVRALGPPLSLERETSLQPILFLKPLNSGVSVHQTRATDPFSFLCFTRQDFVVVRHMFYWERGRGILYI